jgi:2-amino-4-hydroxy-6-hydroxymethyldihydropteridine diphosphokinase
LGRKRSGIKNADRYIDVDILFFNDEIIQTKHLHIPHPRLHLRKFVLIPLNEIAPMKIHPQLKKSGLQLLKECKDDLKVSIFNPRKV